MRKRTLLSNIKAVKRLVLLTLILAAAFPATIRETKAAAGTTFKVKVTDGYLALRSEKAFDKGNEIGQLNTGDTVQVKDTSNDQYWYVYVPQLDKTGYVDRNYLTGGSGTTTPSMTVKVESGYLALRSTKAYDKDNEIAQLNNGDTVEVIEKKDSTYWYVYVPKLGKEGYVDKNYLK